MAQGLLCSSWIDGNDVAACCDADDSSDGSIFDTVALEASELLYMLSGRLYAGECERTVRPCNTRCSCNWQVLSRGHIVWYDWYSGYYGPGSWFCDSSPCGCTPLSTVWLAGYPVQAISEVKIDGAVIDPATYRLDRNRFLVRMRDPAFPDEMLVWPGCQMLDLPDTEPGTWSVTYSYGRQPPQLAIDAAAQLACEVYKQCLDQECALPKGTTRVTRQGITIEKELFLSWGFQPRQTVSRAKGWQTGLPLVDAFLAGVNPSGLIRQPTIWAPSFTRRFAQPVGP